ncbi:hypothetical protein [Devosia sp. A449]
MPVPLPSPPEPAQTSLLEKQAHRSLSSMLLRGNGNPLPMFFSKRDGLNPALAR